MTTNSFGPALMAVSWIFCVIGTIFMILRTFTSIWITGRVKSDFWVASVTYVLGIASQVLLTIGVYTWGLGHHAANLTHQQAVNSQFYQWLFGTTSIAATALGKITVILFILQIESQTKNIRKWFLYFIGVGTMAINITILAMIWTQCTPTRKMWNITVVGNCNGRATEQKVSYFQGSFGAFADLSLSIYPIAVFWTLAMPTNIKIGLSVLFSFGAVAAMTAVMKTVLLHNTLTAPDPTYSRAQLNIWAALEMWIVFIVSCVPVVRPLFLKGLGKVFSSVNGTGRGMGGQSYALNDMERSQGNYSRAFAQSQARSNIRPPPTTKDSDEDELVGKGSKEAITITSSIQVKYDDSDHGIRAH